MDRRTFAVSSLLAIPAIATASNQNTSPAEIQAAHEAWVAATLKRMNTVTPGMTRGDLLKIFSPEGGLVNRAKHTFYSQACMFFRVDVEFDMNPETATQRFDVDDRDLIAKISRPYLQLEMRLD